MYADRVACCPLVSHGEYVDGTDGRTPGRFITLSAMDVASVIRGQIYLFIYNKIVYMSMLIRLERQQCYVMLQVFCISSVQR